MHEDSPMDVMGRLLFWALIVVVGAILLIAVQPLAILPVAVVGVIVAVAWHEAKVPLGLPRRHPVPPRPAALPPSIVPGTWPDTFTGETVPPAPPELEATPEPEAGPPQEAAPVAEAATGAVSAGAAAMAGGAAGGRARPVPNGVRTGVTAGRPARRPYNRRI